MPMYNIKYFFCEFWKLEAMKISKEMKARVSESGSINENEKRKS